MEQILLQILEKNLSIPQLAAMLLVLLIFLIKTRKTNEKIDLISENHLHEISEKLDDIKGEIKDGFNRLDAKVSKVAEDITVIKDRQKRR
jgi:uncharacterized protein YoxC